MIHSYLPTILLYIFSGNLGAQVVDFLNWQWVYLGVLSNGVITPAEDHDGLYILLVVLLIISFWNEIDITSIQFNLICSHVLSFD